jgi:hypothetical protein
MRGFLRKTWNATAKTSSFDEANIPNLAAELEERFEKQKWSGDELTRMSGR